MQSYRENVESSYWQRMTEKIILRTTAKVAIEIYAEYLSNDPSEGGPPGLTKLFGVYLQYIYICNPLYGVIASKRL